MLGSNVPTIGGYATGFKFGDQWGCDCIQIFLTLSRRWDIPKLIDEKVIEFKKSWNRSSVKTIVGHIPYLVNLASPDNVIWKKSIKRVLMEIEYASNLGVLFLVLHPGSYTNTNKQIGLNRIKKALNIISKKLIDQNVRILLETMSGQGSALGSTFKEINYILKNLKKSNFFGVCFDTAHVFHAGYNIMGLDGYKRVFKRFDEIIGIDKIKVIHLNDSKTELGSKVDRHASIGEGRIGLKFFHSILNDDKFYNIPKIIEIPDRDEKSQESLILLRELQNVGRISELKNLLKQLSLEEIY